MRTALFLLLVTAAPLVGCTRTSAVADEPSADPAPALPASANLSTPLDKRTRGWELGRHYEYTLKLGTRVEVGAEATFDFDLDGKLAVVPSAVTPESATLFVVIRDASIVSRVPDTQSDFDKLAAQISESPCFFTITGGRLAEMRVLPRASALTINLYRELASRLQFARAAGEAERYTAEEYDTTGRYLAAYQRDPEQKGLWQKQKTKYLAILTAKETAPSMLVNIAPRVIASRAEIRLSPDGRLTTLRAHDEVEVKGAQAPVHSTMSLSLSAAAVASAPAAQWGPLLAQMDRFAADEPYGGQATVDALDDARIHGLSFDEIVLGLEELAQKEAPRGPARDDDPAARDAREKVVQQDTNLFMALAATFRRRPETVRLAVQKIRGQSKIAKTLVYALGSAGSPAAESALIDLLHAKTSDRELRHRVTFALARTQRPGTKAIDTFKTMLAADPSNTEALYGLGSFSRRLRDQGKSEEAGLLGDLLLGRLAAAETTSELIVALRAIMNSGHAPALPRVALLLGHENEQVRAAAVRALQSMRDQTIDGLLATRVEADESSDVRMSAIDAAKMRAPSEVVSGALAGAAVSALDPHVRYRAVELMVQWTPVRPELRSTLEQVAKNDVEERVRELAKTAL